MTRRWYTQLKAALPWTRMLTRSKRVLSQRCVIWWQNQTRTFSSIMATFCWLNRSPSPKAARQRWSTTCHRHHRAHRRKRNCMGHGVLSIHSRVSHREWWAGRRVSRRSARRWAIARWSRGAAPRGWCSGTAARASSSARARVSSAAFCRAGRILSVERAGVVCRLGGGVGHCVTHWDHKGDDAHDEHEGDQRSQRPLLRCGAHNRPRADSVSHN